MIRIIAVGKLKENYLVNMIEDYLKRINKYHKLNIIEIKDSNSKEEGIKIVNLIEKSHYNIAMDHSGREIDSIQISELLDVKLMERSNLTFIIGGSDGLSKEVLDKVNLKLSFGKITFPHGIFRGVLLEQIYRGFKIMNNERYHK